MKVLITGVCGGIGKAVAEYFLDKGAFVYAFDLGEKPIENKCFYYQKADVTDVNLLNDLKEKYLLDGVSFDAIINIAGIFIIDSFIEAPFEQLQKIFNVNLFGAINVNKVFYPLLNKKGKILITTSEVAKYAPMPFNGIYNTTKTALDSYAQSLRQELNLLGQKVVTIRPGAFNTSLSRGALEKTKELTDKTILYKKQSHKFYNLVKMFMGKPASPSKIAKTYYKAVVSKGNKTVYKKHTNFLLRLMSILPHRLQCFIVKLLLKTKVENN